MKTQLIEYYDNDLLLEGFLAYDESITQARPAILVAHDWSGRNEFACDKALALAKLGYVGFALDMYGKGKLGKNNEEKTTLMTPLMTDRKLLSQRINAAFNTLKQITPVDPRKIACIGFCFGGLCALDLARSGAKINGVVSFHGLLNAAEDINTSSIHAKILALHGHDDPMVTPEQVLAFEAEMTHAKVDWQLHVYGNTLHAFTNPLANDPAFGTVYSTQADKRSWIVMENFFREIF